MIRCLFIEDDYVDQMALKRLVSTESLPWAFEMANTIAEAKTFLQNESFDVIVTDYHLPDGNAFDILQLRLDVPIIIVTGAGSEQVAVDAMQAGANDYLIKDSDRNYLKILPLTLDKSIKGRIIEDRMKAQSASDSASVVIVGNSPAIQETFKLINFAAASDAPVLITGETGTGKNLAAKAIHYKGAFGKGPFIAINCAALPENMIEAELFGYEKGAFTGAVATKRGLFEMAEGGTVYLDEIGEMPFHLQAKLLSVIEDKSLRRLGGVISRDIETRIISSTNIDPERALGSSFRKDLYYRLSVIRIHMPLLKERLDDIPELCRYFLKGLAGYNITLSESELTRLMDYHWPGNVRELRNILERAVMLQGGSDVRPSGLISNSRDNAVSVLREEAIMTLDEIERRHIKTALQRFSGNVTKTAAALGISLATLKRRIKEYGSL
ncbi:MAG: sigma-54-dependent transcriptional regulator [Dissulfurispiraceae bacterium]